MKNWLINISMVKFVWLAALFIAVFSLFNGYINDDPVYIGGELKVAFLVTLKIWWDKKRDERWSSGKE